MTWIRKITSLHWLRGAALGQLIGTLVRKKPGVTTGVPGRVSQELSGLFQKHDPWVSNLAGGSG